MMEEITLPKRPVQTAPAVDIPTRISNLISPSGLQFKIFSFLWAIATLFHMAQSSAFDVQLHYALLSLAALYVIFRPGSVAGFVVLLVLQLQDVYYHMPNVSNHWIFTAFVNVTILLALVLVLIRSKSFKVNTREWFDAFAPAVRIELIILYFYVVFHKLNSGFFNTDASCVADFVHAQNAGGLLPLTASMVTAAIYLTLIIEALIPILLCFRSTRHWGILIGLLFHCLLAFNPLNGFYDFSSMIFAAYFVFCSPQLVQNFAQRWDRLRFKNFFNNLASSNFSYTKLLLFVGLLGAGFLAANVLTKKVENFHLNFFWLGFSVAYILLFVQAMAVRQTTVEPAPTRFFSMPHWSLALIPVAVFLNGLSPYLGLKTENSFAMFSNLRTEGGISNHYLVPASMQFFNYQKDMIEVVSSSDKKLQNLATHHKLMTYFEFRDYVASNRPEHVTYLQNGQEQIFRKAEAEAGDPLLTNNSFIKRKLLNFREVSKFDPQPCSH